MIYATVNRKALHKNAQLEIQAAALTHISCLPNVMLCYHFYLIILKQEKKMLNLVCTNMEI